MTSNTQVAELCGKIARAEGQRRGWRLSMSGAFSSLRARPRTALRPMAYSSVNLALELRRASNLGLSISIDTENLILVAVRDYQCLGGAAVQVTEYDPAKALEKALDLCLLRRLRLQANLPLEL